MNSNDPKAAPSLADRLESVVEAMRTGHADVSPLLLRKVLAALRAVEVVRAFPKTLDFDARPE